MVGRRFNDQIMAIRRKRWQEAKLRGRTVSLVCADHAARQLGIVKLIVFRISSERVNAGCSAQCRHGFNKPVGIASLPIRVQSVPNTFEVDHSHYAGRTAGIRCHHGEATRGQAEEENAVRIDPGFGLQSGNRRDHVVSRVAHRWQVFTGPGNPLGIGAL